MSAEVTPTATRAPRREWTESEIQSLRDGYSHKGAKFLSEKLGRDISSIYQKATKLGLRAGSRLSASEISSTEPVQKVRAYRRKTKLLKEIITSSQPQDVVSFEAEKESTGKYEYNVSIDGNVSVKMNSNVPVLKHSVAFLNIGDLRVRCFVQDVIKKDGGFDLIAIQTSINPPADLHQVV